MIYPRVEDTMIENDKTKICYFYTRRTKVTRKLKMIALINTYLNAKSRANFVF